MCKDKIDGGAMTDRRILKTKKCLKDSLLDLIRQKPLDRITVKEICENGNTGRVTFYTYYSDKYALLADCFQDFQEETTSRYEQLQKMNNPGEDPAAGFRNLMAAMMDTVDTGKALRILMENREILFMYYDFIVKNLETIEASMSGKLRPAYDPKRLNAFLAMGFWGFMHADQNGELSDSRQEAFRLIDDLCASGLFARV
jgi:AcrR family transcriptional regulator